ncbi:MAG: UDP-3-O-(3-hydroxymyristoyl)glucosamine N-acyltransferase [Proteobacteria bacterium]|nr:UDP-3-O-(3-hydroxymyristoyl)glucosamine N-acyltransferase [Pseudomonadota bacterium]
MRLDEIVARFGGELIGDGQLAIQQVATLERAGPTEITFLANSKYREKLGTTNAGAVILAPEMAKESPTACIVSANPYLYFARVAQCLNPAAALATGIHPSATVESDIPATACVAAGAYIGPRALIGERARIGPGCVIGAGAELGADALLHANVTIYAGCQIGARVIIHSGAVIGADGFGFARQQEGDDAGAWLKIPQIGHNVRIGAHSALAGCVGIAGSATLGRRCTVGGGAVILGHLKIADDVNISAGTLVAKSIPKAGNYTGALPFLEHSQWLKNFAHLRQLDTMADRIRALEAQVKMLATMPGKPEDEF